MLQARSYNHDQAFTNLLQTAKGCNVKLNFDKFQYKQNKVEVFGETYTRNDCKPSKYKVAAITSISSPTNKKQVPSFIGMINYLAKFSPRLSEPAELIREFAQEKVPFNWDPEHQDAFTCLKKETASASTLAYYNSKKQSHPADRCQHWRTWNLPATRFQTSQHCKQDSHRCPKRLCCD